MTPKEEIVDLPIDRIVRGFFQPREYFDPLAMESTKRSIQEKGQKYPVVVRPILAGNPLFDITWDEIHYELADGERRFRCCQELGMATLKAIIRDLKDEEMLDYTLTTNDSLALNPIEKATVFSRLAKEFNRSQAEIAVSFNLKQQQVSEYIRLLELPQEIQDLTARAVISVRHARELLKIQDKKEMEALAKEISEKSVTTRDLTKKVKEIKTKFIPIIQKVDESDIIFENSAELDAKAVRELADGIIAGSEETKKGFFSPFIALNRLLVPKKYYEKLDYWLKFKLGSTKEPAEWLLNVEFSILIGMFFVFMAVFLPHWAILGLLGLCVTALAAIFTVL